MCVTHIDECARSLRGSKYTKYTSLPFFKNKYNIAATSENVPSDMCARRRFRSACAFAQSDQHLHLAHIEQPRMQKFLHADNEDSDQTARMRRQIWDLLGTHVGRRSADLVWFRTGDPLTTCDENYWIIRSLPIGKKVLFSRCGSLMIHFDL